MCVLSIEIDKATIASHLEDRSLQNCVFVPFIERTYAANNDDNDDNDNNNNNMDLPRVVVQEPT
eukprot:3907321-Amphidinium_carterae.1